MTSLFKVQGLMELQRLTFPGWRYVPAVVYCRPSVLGPSCHSSRFGDDSLGIAVHIDKVVLRSLGSMMEPIEKQKLGRSL